MAKSKPVNLGKFMQDSGGVLHGRISGLGIGSTSVISQVATSQEGKPYLKLIADPLDNAYEIGAAFPKEKDGLNYYSINLDSPLFAAPLNAALFPDKNNEGMFNLVWNRADAPKPSADATFDVGQPQGRRFIGAGAAP